MPSSRRKSLPPLIGVSRERGGREFRNVDKHIGDKLMFVRFAAALSLLAGTTFAVGGASAATIQFSIGTQPPAPAQRAPTWSSCARENGFCRVPYATTVRYGANGRYVTLPVAAGVECSNRVFGDPVAGTTKHCDFQAARAATVARVANPRYCADEGGFCNFSGTARVVYGNGSQVTSQLAANGVACSNRVFGDPAPGKPKSCYVLL